MVYSAFKDQSREFNIFLFSGCEFMTETDYPICRFPNFNYSMVLHELKPDIVFILTRYLNGRARFDPMKPIDEDTMFQDFMRHMNEVEEVAKKVYLLQAIPSCVESCNLKALAFTGVTRPLREIKEGLIRRDEFFARARVTEVAKRCKKCEIIDYLPLLVDENGHYLGYDPKTNLMYHDSTNHFNRFGKERLRKLFYDLAEKLKSETLV